MLDAMKAKPHKLLALPAGAYGLVEANALSRTAGNAEHPGAAT